MHILTYIIDKTLTQIIYYISLSFSPYNLLTYLKK